MKVLFHIIASNTFTSERDFQHCNISIPFYDHFYFSCGACHRAEPNNSGFPPSVSDGTEPQGWPSDCIPVILYRWMSWLHLHFDAMRADGWHNHSFVH